MKSFHSLQTNLDDYFRLWKTVNFMLSEKLVVDHSVLAVSACHGMVEKRASMPCKEKSEVVLRRLSFVASAAH